MNQTQQTVKFSFTRLLELAVNYYSLSFSIITCVLTLFLYFFLHHPFIESFLFSTLIINIGMRGVVAFVGNWFPIFSEDIAEKYGWERQNTFQREIAAADGAFAVLGILSYWLRGDFWVAVIIGSSVCWILSEIANIASILQGRRDPTKKLDPDYEVSNEIFAGMHIDLVMVVFQVWALSIWKGWI